MGEISGEGPLGLSQSVNGGLFQGKKRKLRGQQEATKDFLKKNKSILTTTLKTPIIGLSSRVNF